MRRHQHTRGPKQHLVEGPERDKACGLPTLLLDAMSHDLSKLLIAALPNTDSGFPFFVQFCGQNGGRVSEFEFEGDRYEVHVVNKGPKVRTA